MALYREARYRVSGDRALALEFGDQISSEINQRVLAMAQEIEAAKINGVTECLPSYNVLYVFYDPLAVRLGEMVQALKRIENRLQSVILPEPRTSVIPTLYGGEVGPDLEDVARHTGFSPAEVVRIHSSAEYRIYFTGFTPGFPFLGGLPPALATPRLDTPRTRVPAGSVGIAGNQTGIYPVESPGGWRLIGRTPLRLYDPSRPEPVLLKAGDRVRFLPVGKERYAEIALAVESGEYVVENIPAESGKA